MGIKVLKPGLLSTVQDLGRTGYQKLGIIASGAMDPLALRVSNILVGNEEYDAALEVTILGPTLYFIADTLIAICGGDLSPAIDGKPVPLWRAVFVREGSTLTFGAAKNGCRAYLAVAGGFDVPIVMGSRSTYLRASIGGFQGRTLKEGDILDIRPMHAISRSIMLRLSKAAMEKSFQTAPNYVASDIIPGYTRNPVIRVIRGKQFDEFDTASKEAFFQSEFNVLPQSDRMGYRLQGTALQLAKPLEMISEAVTFGTIQVPSDGNPIILMADRQTTGGYPKIAQVIAADLPLLAQVNLGGKIRFAEITLEEAQELYVIREMELQLLKQGVYLHYKL